MRCEFAERFSSRAKPIFHDLSESITGDILPKNKNEEARENEREVYKEIALYGTYGDIANISEIYELWDEFEAQH